MPKRLSQRRLSRRLSSEIKRKGRQTQSIYSSLQESRQKIFSSRRNKILEELERERQLEKELEERRKNIEEILSSDLQTTVEFFKNTYTQHLRKIGAFRQINETNFCCSTEEFEMLLRFTSILKIKFPEMTNRDICISLLYVYYSLNLLEQTTEYMNGSIYSGIRNGRRQRPRYADNPDLVDDLIIKITTGEILVELNGAQHDIASEIRRRFMFGPS